MKKILLLPVALLLLAAAAPAQTVDDKLLSNLKWRLVGPFRGGRSVAVAGSKARPKEYYFGATGGGVWKTTDGGENWDCVSDGFFKTSSVGALAVVESNPDIVYAGMGERDIRGNIAEGDGVYKSTDGGKTWSNIGLRETKTISRIVVDPKNPDTVFVAALGHVYGPNRERGVYKSTDAGRTWKQVLFESEKAGAVDLCLDPSNPQTLFAATWEAWRTPYSLNSGGPGSKLYKSVDGGEHWTDITRSKGLPSGVIGKIGVSVSPVNPKRIWAIVEALEGGIFRSDDGGDTWQLTNGDRNWRQRAWYYSHVIADTKDADSVYVLNVGMGKSTDGGKTFRGVGTPHSDNHDLWIAPDDPNRMIESNDGGASVSTDGGRTWTEQDVPTAQFYHVSADNAYPYHILGAQQDNSPVRILSRTFGGGITRNDWTNTAGGESGYVVAKPDNPDIVFGGNYSAVLEVQNHATGIAHDINPWPDNPMGHGAIDLEQRFQWTFPIVFSPHDPNTLYTSSQYLLKTTNGGQTWKRISPDLTRNDPNTLGSSGGPITKDNTSVEYYATIFTVAESPVAKGVIWTGSDDGLVHISRNGGSSWSSITPKEMPKWGLCSMIEASPHDAGTAYLAVDNHENDDWAPYFYRTTDFGRSWTKITSGIPDGAFARSIREDPVRKGLLYAGTETGVYVSFDSGANWRPLQSNLPLTPIHDLVVKNDDLVVATHGRSFWVLDNLSSLRQASGVDASQPFLFEPKPAISGARGGFGGGGGRGGQQNAGPSGQNPPSGILIDYYLPTAVEKVHFDFIDRDGKTVASVDRSAGEAVEAGAHRFSQTLSYPSFKGFPGMILWAAGSAPFTAPPGEYTVKMTVGDKTQTKKLRLVKDPRTPASQEDLIEQYRFSRKIADRTTEANDAVIVIRDLKEKIDKMVEASKGDAQIKSAGDDLKAKLSAVEGEIYQVQNRSGQDPLNYPIKLNNRLAALLGTVQSGPFRPTDQSYQVFDMLSKQLQIQLDALKKIRDTDLSAYNARLRVLNLGPIVPIDPATAPRGGGGRGGGGEEDEEQEHDGR